MRCGVMRMWGHQSNDIMHFSFFIFSTVIARLRVILLAFNRPDQLLLTLQSLSRAFFPEGTPLSIHVDGPANDPLVSLTLAHAYDFQWPFGPKSVVSSPHNRGILGQWKAAWDPTDDEYALFIEDDIEISPAAPIILTRLIRQYKSDPSLYGIALQRAQWVMGAHQDRKWRRLDLAHQRNHRQHTPVFKYFATGTWGQLIFPGTWRRFLTALPPTADAVTGLLSDHWAMERADRNLFSPVFNRFVLSQQPLYNLYLNYPNGTALAISRQPLGVITQFSRYCYSERLLTESEALKLILDEPAIVKNHCWDSLDLSREHLEELGFVITAGPRCCLEGRWRLQVIPGNEVWPQFRQPDSFLGCWESDPAVYLKQFLPSGQNIQFISQDSNALIGTLAFNRKESVKQIIVPLTRYNPRTANFLSDGITCSTMKCPYRPNKYPAGYTTKHRN